MSTKVLPENNNKMSTAFDDNGGGDNYSKNTKELKQETENENVVRIGPVYSLYFFRTQTHSQSQTIFVSVRQWMVLV